MVYIQNRRLLFNLSDYHKVPNILYLLKPKNPFEKMLSVHLGSCKLGSPLLKILLIYGIKTKYQILWEHVSYSIIWLSKMNEMQTLLRNFKIMILHLALKSLQNTAINWSSQRSSGSTCPWTIRRRFDWKYMGEIWTSSNLI